MSKKIVLWLFLAAIVAGIGMRFYGLSWGLPYHFHSDERVLSYHAEKLRTAESLERLTAEERRFFLYPPFLMYLLNLLIAIVSVFRPFSPTDPGSITLYYLLGRGIVACFGAATLILVYRLGKRLYNESVGRLASVFLAFTVLHVRDSHFYFPDIPMTFFVVLTVFFAVGIAEGKGIRSYIATGIIAGLGMATKQTAMMVLPVIVTAHVIGSLNRQSASDRPQKKAWLSFRFWVLMLLPLLTAGITYLMLNPFIFINFRNFLEMGRHIQRFIAGADRPQWSYQFTGETVLYWFTNLFYFGQGVLLEVIIVAGTLWAMVSSGLRVSRDKFKKLPVADLLLLSFILPYIFYVGSGYNKFIRYTIPVLPFLCLLGARFLFALYDSTKQKTVRLLIGVGVAVVILVSFLNSLAYLNIYRQPDVRLQASRWIHQNIPPQSTVLIDSASSTPLLGSMFFKPELTNSYIVGVGTRHLIKKDYFTIKVMNLITELRPLPKPREWWENYLKERLKNVEYIVMSDEYFEQYRHRPDEYPFLMGYYQDLFSGRLGFEPMKTFKTYPALFGHTLNDDRAELTFRLFDHPKIMIFKRISP